MPQSPTLARVAAVIISMVCWAATYVGFTLLVAVVIMINLDEVNDAPTTARDVGFALWGGASMALATRFAARVLRRRGVEPVLWLVIIPAALVAYDLLQGTAPGQPIWPAAVLAVVALTGSIAAVTLWELPAPRDADTPRRAPTRR